MKNRAMATAVAVCLIWVLGLMSPLAGGAFIGKAMAGTPVERIDVEKARDLVESGEALLICSYNDKACKHKLLDGAILMSELEKRLDSLPISQMLIFYCE
jgi:hypothetical protein